MAERRMFSKSVIDSDLFLEMPLSTQALYFHLAMRADDDGFVNNPRKIARMIGADNDSLKILIAKSLLIPFETGIVVIRHWRLHNYIQKDRYKETIYKDEKSTLELQKNGVYETLDTKCIQDVSSLETQVRLGKVSIDKDIIKENIKEKKSDFEKIISEYTDNAELQNVIRDFIKQRKALKSPMTERALKLSLTTLDKLGSNDREKIDIINQSIERGWKGLFPLKADPKAESKANEDMSGYNDIINTFLY